MTSVLGKNDSGNLAKVNYSALVEKKEGGYQATVWGLPEFSVFDINREEALKKLHQLVNHRLKNLEVVTQEVTLSKPENPWIKFAGMYKENPVFDEVIAYMEAYRQELDAEEE